MEFGSSKICRRMAATANLSGDITATAKESKKYPAVSYIEKKTHCPLFSSIESRENEKFNRFFLDSLVTIALDNNQTKIVVYENDKRCFVLERREGNLEFNEINRRSKKHAQETTELFQIPISALTSAMENMAQGKPVSESDKPFATLIKNNNLLEVAHQHYLNDPYSVGSNLGKQFWEKRHATSVQSWGNPVFPMEGVQTEGMSEALKSFCDEGSLPETNQELGLLFWEFCSLVTDESGDAYRHYMLKNVTHLDFSLTDVGESTIDSLKTIRRICQFLSKHFDGNAVSFKGVFGSAEPGSSVLFEQAITILVNNNPNLTSISFTNCVLHGRIIPQLAESLKTNITMCSLYFDLCAIGSGELEELTETLKKSTKIKELTIKNCYLQLDEILGLIAIPTLEFLQIEEKGMLKTEAGQAKIWAALQDNRTLTSFHGVEWLDAEDAQQCKTHLMQNRFYRDYNSYRNLHAVMHSEEAADLPNDIYRFIQSCVIAVNVRSFD